MPTNFGSLPSNNPLPVGQRQQIPGAASQGGRAFPGGINHLTPDPGATIAAQLYVERPERVWCFGTASAIFHSANAGWNRFDVQLRLLTSVAGGPFNTANDLNGKHFFQNAMSNESHATSDGTNVWWGQTINGMFYLEAVHRHVIQFMSMSGGIGISYWAGQTHYYLSGYTVGEGIY